MEHLQQIKPKNLYVAADGPRPNHPLDAEKCRQAREIAMAIDWPCDIKTRFLDENMGCDPAVSSAIDWFFQHEEYGIIFEDDCIVHSDFFSFCGELLVRFSDDERIMQISSLAPYDPRDYSYDYHFSHAFRCSGGWATWRRAWKYYTSDMHRYSDVEAGAILKAYFSDLTSFQQHYRKFLEFQKGHFNNWDFQWNMACFAQNGLSIVPEKNLMTNIGFDEEGTHTRTKSPVFEKFQTQPLQFPLRHPHFVYADGQPERGLEKFIYRSLSIKSRWMYLFRRALGAVSYLREVMPYR